MKKVLLLTIGILLAGYGTASAQPFTPTMAADTYGIAQGGVANGIATPNETVNPIPLNVKDAINLLMGTSYAHNTDVDFLRHSGPDIVWTSGGNADALVILIGGSAARSNTLNVYNTLTPNVKIPVISFGPIFDYTGDGSLANPFVAANNTLASGTTFGWSLFTEGSGVNDTWDSFPPNNINGFDHLLAYNLSALGGQSVNVSLNGATQEYTFLNPYLLTWEDKRFENGLLGDEDYNDLMYLVTRVAPVSGPTVPEPLSLSLMGGGLLGMVGLRKRKV